MAQRSLEASRQETLNRLAMNTETGLPLATRSVRVRKVLLVEELSPSAVRVGGSFCTVEDPTDVLGQTPGLIETLVRLIS